ncbi:MAG: DnaA/Hda family protein [Thermoguttaceae bacterium]|nr:DnaA/Hda family protein [Thermoguttaceae bacterium]
MDIESLILEALPQRVGRQCFDTWFGNHVHFDLRQSNLYVSASDSFRVTWLRDNLAHHIDQVCVDLFGTTYPLCYMVGNVPVDEYKTWSNRKKRLVAASSNLAMNGEYTQTATLEQSAIPERHQTDSLDLFSPNQAAVLKEQSPVSSGKPSVVATKVSRSELMDSMRSLSFPDSTDCSSKENCEDELVDVFDISPNGLNTSVVSKKQNTNHVFVPDTQTDNRRQLVPRNPQGGPGRDLELSSAAKTTRTNLVSPQQEPPLYNTVDVRAPKAGSSRNASLNVGRTFETFSTFVEGMSNRLACSVAQIALTEPGKINPVYIYGGTSVGKTHLLEAIYSEFRQRSRFGAPLFMSAEQFTTLFLQSIRGKSDGPSFRDRFNNISLFILDDVHFLKGKDVTQCELVSIIDMLKRRNVQLFLSGNSPLSELTDMRPDLIARLEGGFFCRIESPERETLLKIFKQQAHKLRFAVPDDVCRFIVSRLSSHARLIFGALTRLYATHLATGAPVTVEMARNELGDFLQCSRRTIRLEDIEAAVLEIFGLQDESLRTKSRAKQFSYPRMLAMYLARKYTRSALSEIGRYFGDRSHSTVISAQKKIDSLLAECSSATSEIQLPTVAQTIERIERILQI